MLKVAFKYFDNKTAYVIEVLNYILSSLRKKRSQEDYEKQLTKTRFINHKKQL